MTSEGSNGGPRLVAVIVTHGTLANGLADAVRQVIGVVPGIEAVSNEGLSSQALVQRVREVVQAVRADGCIVFVDSRGSSCANSCLEAVRDLPDVRVVSGVNLPMVMDFALRRNDHSLDEMVRRLLVRGRNSVQELEGPST
jgi:PTS system mannose-specific IIA component